MTKMTREELTWILADHELWLDTDQKLGGCANLAGADLAGLDLAGVNLAGAILIYTNFTGAYISLASPGDASSLH